MKTFLFGMLLAASVAAFSPCPVQAYSVGIHYRIPTALAHDEANGVERTAAMPNDGALERFRLQVYELFAATADPELRSRFLEAYPSAARFDAAAFKEFFGMAATHPALGFDESAAVAAHASNWEGERSRVKAGDERTLVEWVRLGSIYPDLDYRNRGRWWRDGDRFARLSTGERIPADPVILNMGRVEELSGQAHAHYGLNNNPKSDDPAVLKERPADFAVPVGFDGPVLTFAPERAQAYGDLAVLARHFDQPALAAIYAGNAYHYLADVANQIHTVQVGTYDFFVDATIEGFKQKVVCLWGWRCEAADRKQIGIDMIGNHHTWSEEYFRIAIERAEAGTPLHTVLATVEPLWRPDARLATEWSKLLHGDALLQALADAIIVKGNEEAPRIYELTREITVDDMRKAGYKVAFDEKGDAVTLRHLDPRAAADLVGEFLGLESRGLVRASTAMHLWWNTHLAPASAPDWRAAADRLLRMQLDERDQAGRRRAKWIDEQQGR